MEVRINLNEQVKFKLTDFGKDIYYHQFDDLNERIIKNGGKPIVPHLPKEDENGYCEMQLWALMNLYGNHMICGQQDIFKPLEIVYKNEALQMVNFNNMTRKEYEKLPIEEKLKKLNELNSKILEEKKLILDNAFYCNKCKTYHYKSDVKTVSRKETVNELTHCDAGYGDDDMYGDVTYLFIYEVCPKCGHEKVKEKFFMSIQNEKRRYE